MIRIIFVMDILKGKVVHALRGERTKYRPVEISKICDSSDPLEIISVVMPHEVYIADLDHLQHLGNNFGVIKKISGKTRTMVDIGVKDIEDAGKCAAIADTVIVGTETASFDVIEKAAKEFPGRINVSIDMKYGKVLAKDIKTDMRPEELIRYLNGIDIKDIIILDLGKVGTSSGIDKDFFKKMADISNHSIIAGGGVKDMDDIKALADSGISGALVATALHNGKIPIDLIH